MPTDVLMSPADVRAARESLGLSPESLAAELGVVPGVVHGWEDGTIPATGRPAQLLAWRAAVAAHERAFEAQGLAECTTVGPLIHRVVEGKAKAETIDAHVAGCATCQARIAFARTLPPVPEYPHTSGMRAMGAIAGRIGRLPAWLRPAAWGALGIGAMVTMRMVLSMAAVGPRWEHLGMLAMGLLAGGYLGAVGGITFHVVRPLMRRLGTAGAYLTGIACVLACMLAFFVPMALLGSDDMLARPGGWIVIGAMSVLFGLIVGHFMRDHS